MNKTSLPLVYDQSQQQVAETMKAIGQPAYRAKQLWQGIYQNLWSNPSDFSIFQQDYGIKLVRHTGLGHSQSVPGRYPGINKQ